MISIISLALAGCGTTTENQRRGAGVGAATGAVIGGVIGHQSGEALEGAAVGAAAGGLAGGAYGTHQDRQERRTRADAAGLEVDSFGYAPTDYLALMTPAEMDILESRTSSRDAEDMVDHLTAEEKENLRQRAALAE